MAEAVVSSLVEKLGEFIQETKKEVKFLLEVSDQVQQLQGELKRMQCFLKDADKRKDETECVRNWVAEIRELAYEADDVIETYALKVESRREGDIWHKIKRPFYSLGEANEVHTVGSEIEKIKTRIFDLTRSLQTYGIRLRDGSDPNPLIERQREQRETFAHDVEDTDVVGFEKNIKELVECLVTEEKRHRVVSICGMGGLGKTTIAKKVYHDDKVKHHFECRAWAYISQQCQRRPVWEGILVSLLSPSDTERDRISKLKDEEVAKELHQIQREKKCLAIIDDIWSTEAWDLISAAFPSTDTDTGSKILLTSRNKEVALQVDPRGFLHEPQCLNDKQSWELLHKKAISWREDSKCKIDMEELGTKMVRCCKGLPLAITVLGGLLATKHTLEEWKEVHGHVKLDLYEQKDQRFSQVLTLSYDDLPYHLKPCFLYLGHFPEDLEIPTKKLIRMWMAEGFISPMQAINGRVEKMEDTGERYLRKLVQRCMVQVGEKCSIFGRIKTLRVHDVMRDLCLSKAIGENFLQCIKYPPKENEAMSVGKVRRFSIYCNGDEVPIKLIPLIYKESPYIRSLLYFIPGSIFIKNWQLMSSMFKDFKLLRVLDLKNIRVGRCKLPKEIGCLIHLRFLTLDSTLDDDNCLRCMCCCLCFMCISPCCMCSPCCMRSACCMRPCCAILWFKCKEMLPSSLGNLRCLQTLDLQKFGGCQVIIPKVIQKMKQLRHLYLPWNCVIRGKLQWAKLSHLQTLVNIPLSVRDLEDLANLTNLTKLRIHLKGTLEKDEKIRMPTLEILRSLKVYIEESAEGTDIRPIVSRCPHLYKLSVDGNIEKLPEVNQISPNLTKLTLFDTCLEEDPMPTLEKLPKLKFLYLYEALARENMVCSARGFPQLQSLYLYGLHNLEEWTVEEGAMPSLCYLIVVKCHKLKMVPEGLRFVTTLQELKILDMPEEFTNKVEKGGQDFYKIQHVPSVVIKHRMDK